MSNFILTTAVILGLIAGHINLIRRKWLLNVFGLAIQYLCIFIVFPKTESFIPAIIKLIVGLMAALIIYLTILGTGAVKHERISLKLSAGEVFRGLSGLFLVLLILIATPWLQSEVFPQSSRPALILSMGLMLLGLLQLGSKAEPFYIVIGLLTFLSGFELLYGSLEFSNLLEALFAMVNLLLSIAGAYFIVKDLETEAS